MDREIKIFASDLPNDAKVGDRVKLETSSNGIDYLDEYVLWSYNSKLLEFTAKHAIDVTFTEQAL